MVQQVTRDQILGYITNHPKALVKDIASQFGITTNLASAKLKQYFDNGFVTREVAGQTLSKKDYYSYTVVKKANGRPRQERKAMQAKETVASPPPAKEPPPVEFSLNPWIQNMAEALARQVAAQFSVALHKELQAAMPQLPALPVVPKQVWDLVPVGTSSQVDVSYTTHQPPRGPVEVPAPSETKRKPRVGVVGIAPPKRTSLENEYGSVFDLHFWWSEDGERRLKSMIGCEIVFVMDYVAHKHTQQLTAMGANWRKVNGDIARLGDDLMDYFLKEGTK